MRNKRCLTADWNQIVIGFQNIFSTFLKSAISGSFSGLFFWLQQSGVDITQINKKDYFFLEYIYSFSEVINLEKKRIFLLVSFPTRWKGHITAMFVLSIEQSRKTLWAVTMTQLTTTLFVWMRSIQMFLNRIHLIIV